MKEQGDAVGRSSFMARRLGALGLGAIVVGGVLLGTSVAVSAQTTSKSAAVAPNKKKPTTTTTSTSTTVPPPSTTTQPCSASPATETGTNTSVSPNTTATLTMDPATCIVSGTVVTLSGSGFQPNSPGTVLECNSDAAQPFVQYPAAGDDIPVSCTDPFAPKPGIVVTSATGDMGPVNFTVLEAVDGVGPPCGNSCTGLAAHDCTSATVCTGNPATDAMAYPCPPTAAQIAAGDTCGVLYGDNNGDAITVPISFNTLVAPPLTVPPTPPATPSVTAAPAAKAAAATTKAATGALAFTGTGPGLWWLALVGMMLMALGLLALAVVDQPRRLVRLVLRRVSRSEPRSP